jgi:hypothetical protein
MCFAGQGVVSAYELCQSLEFSGLVYSQRLTGRVPAIFHDAKASSYVLYLSPLKSGEQELLHFNWTEFILDEELTALRKDAEMFVLRSFWAHNKDCSLREDAKVHNTVKLLKRLLIASDDFKALVIISLSPNRQCR